MKYGSKHTEPHIYPPKNLSGSARKIASTDQLIASAEAIGISLGQQQKRYLPKNQHILCWDAMIDNYSKDYFKS